MEGWYGLKGSNEGPMELRKGKKVAFPYLI